jgi:predicted Rossmann-fold nucleotide-binding protein
VARNGVASNGMARDDMDSTVVIPPEGVDARVGPRGSLEHLSQAEISQLMDSGRGGLYSLFRKCALAVLNSGAAMDDAREIFERYRDFEIHPVRQAWGIKLEMRNAPPSAFVDGEMIRGIKEHLFAVLRDVVFMGGEDSSRFDPADGGAATNAVFHILRNARLLDYKGRPNLIVCWGGHAVSTEEYQYSKKVGYELGLRGLDVCTGCGPGAMKGPMKGATIGHAKQRIEHSRYIGITEPGIIAAEPPNPIVNHLVVMPDIEKRLEAFVRVGHGIVVFPGGVGTAEEILYLTGILLNPDNHDQPLPVILTGPRESAAYFEQIRRFIAGTLGDAALSRLQLVIDDPAGVARRLVRGVDAVREHRRQRNDSYGFNWLLAIEPELQRPFEVTHGSMRALDLSRNLPVHQLAANLRRAFSGIVSGNVKESGIKAIERSGPFEIRAEAHVARLLDELLSAFVAQRRMKLPGSTYRPVYRLVA